jgi:hypothetical protein
MRLALATAAVALAASLGCIQAPKGSCDTRADCTKGEACDGGVCVRVPPVPGNGSGGGTDPTSFSTVAWSNLATSASAAFAPASVSADALTGNVLVGARLDGLFDPWVAGTGAVVVRAAGSGNPAVVARFPTFSHGALRTVGLPDGGLLFAGGAVDPTSIGTTFTFLPPITGSLVLGRLDATGDPIWAVTVDGTDPAIRIAPVAVAARGTDLIVTGTGSGDFGCVGGDTGQDTYVAALAGADGRCLWSRGLANRTVSDVEARPAGDVVVGGLCAPSGTTFDPGTGTSCATGLFVAVLNRTTGATTWARFSSGSGTVTEVRDLAVAPDGSVGLVGDGRGLLALGATTLDLGPLETSFATILDGSGSARPGVRPVEAPYAPLPDAVSFAACAFDRSGRLWIAGRYYGQPTVAGTRFTKCRDTCATAAFLARLDPRAGAAPRLASFLPVRVAETSAGVAWVDDLVLAATTGTVAWSFRFSGNAPAPAGVSIWNTNTAGLATVRVVP